MGIAGHLAALELQTRLVQVGLGNAKVACLEVRCLDNLMDGKPAMFQVGVDFKTRDMGAVAFNQIAKMLARFPGNRKQQRIHLRAIKQGIFFPDPDR